MTLNIASDGVLPLQRRWLAPEYAAVIIPIPLNPIVEPASTVAIDVCPGVAFMSSS